MLFRVSLLNDQSTLAENVVDVQLRNCLVLRMDPEGALSTNIQFKRKQSYNWSFEPDCAFGNLERGFICVHFD